MIGTSGAAARARVTVSSPCASGRERSSSTTSASRAARGEDRQGGGEAVGVAQIEGERTGVAQRLADQPRVAQVVLHQQDAQRRHFEST
jgi:hypothetical protein